MNQQEKQCSRLSIASLVTGVLPLVTAVALVSLGHSVLTIDVPMRLITVLLILSLPFSFVTGMIVVAVDVARSESRGKSSCRLTICGLCALLLCLTLCPSLFINVRDGVRRISCASNLKSIGLAMRMYAADWGGSFPPPDGAAGLELLRAQGYLENHKMFVCPATTTIGQEGLALNEEHIDYAYRGGLTEDAPADTPLAWDKPDNHRHYGNVLSVDGHVTGFAGQDSIKQEGIEGQAREDVNARP
jgi:hypothetical protein